MSGADCAERCARRIRQAEAGMQPPAARTAAGQRGIRGGARPTERMAALALVRPRCRAASGRSREGPRQAAEGRGEGRGRGHANAPVSLPTLAAAEGRGKAEAAGPGPRPRGQGSGRRWRASGKARREYGRRGGEAGALRIPVRRGRGPSCIGGGAGGPRRAGGGAGCLERHGRIKGGGGAGRRSPRAGRQGRHRAGKGEAAGLGG